MKRGARLLGAALLAATAMSFFSGPAAQAGVLGRQRPSYGNWITSWHNGEPTRRYVYNGYKEGFSIPAIYYYGYPHTERTYGMGLDAK